MPLHARADATRNRDFVLVSDDYAKAYWAQWKAIRREWWGAGIESIDQCSGAAFGCRIALDELRATVRQFATYHPGSCLIPV